MLTSTGAPQIGRFGRCPVAVPMPGAGCLSLCYAVPDLVIVDAPGLALTDFKHHQLADMRVARRAQSPVEMTA